MNYPKTYKSNNCRNFMEIKGLVNTLHSLERKLIPFLDKYSNFNEIVKNSGMQEIEVMRSLQWLENKQVLKIETKETKLILLTDKAKVYKELPERIIINNLSEKDTTLEKIKEKTKLSDIEVNATIGLLKKKAAIEITKDQTLKIRLNEEGKKLQSKKTIEEELFNKLLKNNLELDSIKDLEKLAFENLRSRGLLTINLSKERSIKLTDLGKQLVKEKIDTNIIESLTPAIIRNKEWKKRNFRGYDIKINVPSINRGKRHFVDQSIEYIKRIWLDLGFKEMTGNHVDTAFWDLDALFVPQDHPARDMQDTFFVGHNRVISKGKLPEELSKKIKEVHENGWTTGSKGWGGKWKPEIAKELLLRTHTTVLSARTLSKLKKEDIPAKFFAVGKVYRNEALDWKHLFEFYQVDGIVIDPDANLRNLKGYLKEFFRKMGYTDVKIKPSFFGYTGISAEIFAYNPIKRQWVEVGGSGIFRPEVTKPLLGFECPVLAWGIGMERIATSYYNISDLRQIYGNDLKMLREVKEFIK